jgi:hypothetical protein
MERYNMVETLVSAAGVIAPKTKFERFKIKLESLGNKLVSTGAFESYKTEVEDGGFPVSKLILTSKSVVCTELGTKEHKAIAKEYFGIMLECGITDDEFENSHGGIYYDLHNNLEVQK